MREFIKKSKKQISFLPIALSLIFLVNPNISIIDIFPDLIGYILLCYNITKLADINDTMAEALAIFKRVIFLDGAKLLALMWIFGISVTSERNSSLLLWSFVFGVLEIVFVIPAFLKLFKGMTELGYVYDNSSIISNKKGTCNRRSFTDKCRTFTLFFIVVKISLSVLPELSDLTSTEYYVNHGMTNMYRYIGIMRFLAFVPVMVIGIIWIGKIIAYFCRIDRDSTFIEAINKNYEERLVSRTGLFVKRNINVAFILLVIAIAFSFDFRLDNINLLPDVLSAVFFIAYFGVIGKKTKMSSKATITLSFLYFAVSLISYMLELSFFEKYYYGAILRSEEAMSAFRLHCASACVSAIMFFIISVSVLASMKKVIYEHTGNAFIHGKSNIADELQKKIDKDSKAELVRYLKYCFVAAVLYVATDIGYVLFAKDIKYMLLINVLGAIIFAIAYIKAYSEIMQAVNSKYMFE